MRLSIQREQNNCLWFVTVDGYHKDGEDRTVYYDTWEISGFIRLDTMEPDLPQYEERKRINEWMMTKEAFDAVQAAFAEWEERTHGL
jgi:hypothetical protein